MTIEDLHVKKRFLRRTAGLFFAGSVLCATLAIAQNENGDWHLTGGEGGQSGWQKGEVDLTANNAASEFKFLWKIKLGEPSKTARSFSEPLMATRLINAEGFKDIVYWSSGDTLYAVDSELGSVIWTKKFESGRASPGCGVSSLGLLMEPPIVINFRSRRTRPPGTPRPPDAPPAQTSERRLGVAPGGGYFGLKGIYVLTADGMLHEQVMTTGADFAPPVNFADKTVFTATGRGCGGVSNGLWAVDLAEANYPVASYSTQPVKPLALTGPVVTTEGTSIFVTSAGTSDAEVHASSVVSVAKDMKVQDWFTPEEGMAVNKYVSPVIFTYKEKQLVAAPGKDGSIALLDATSLGGADHHTPLFETSAITKTGEKHGWDGFASWTEKDGATWVLASVSAGFSLDGAVHASNAHGGIIAFKIEDTNGKLALNPVWASQDMVNPAPPRIANGVVVALAGGDASTHAKLSVLNATTGVELYSSKDEVPTYADLSGVSVGDSHAFFTDHNNVLYSFGIGLEH
jgi:outer membrane protein assembly factor BamB